MKHLSGVHNQVLYRLGLLVFFLFWITSAHAARTVTSATLNGASSTTVAPSASINTVVNVTTTNSGGNSWQSTKWQIGSGTATCVDHLNHTGSGSYTETFPMTAPTANGIYGVSFIAYSDDNCTLNPSLAYTLSNALTIIPPAPSLTSCWVENFSDSNLTNNWTIIKQQNYIPQVIGGKLMLTNAGGSIATGMTLSGQLPANNNYLTIEFEQNAYGGSGADGITLTLSDAAVTPVAGAFGGSLGYAQKVGSDCTTPGGCPGFAGGWLGFGIDEYGNFSSNTEGRNGGPSQQQDSFAIRGSGSGITGYNYIAGTTTLNPGIDLITSSTPAPGHKYLLSIDTRNNQTWVKVERNTGSGYTTIINWVNATQTAISPVDFRLSLTGSTGGSTNNHSVDNFTLNALNCGTIGRKISTLSSSFEAWDIFRSISDRNISTKIVGKPFDLNISSFETTKTALQDFNGTVCARIVNLADQNLTGWNKLLFNNAKSVSTTFTLNQAIGGSNSAGVDLHWITNQNATCPLTTETNTTHATDRFSVRPTSLSMSAPNAIAGVDFNLTFSAPNFTAGASSNYNETVGSSFDVSVAEHNASCITGTFSTPITSGWSFSNGSKILTTSYSEVGILDINLSDTSKPCASRYAAIDCDDANVSDGTNWTANLLPIGSYSQQITLKPHHFDLNATLSNSHNGNFTYLSNDLNMSASFDLNVTAKNAQSVATLNYDKGCYAKNTTVTLPHSSVPNPLSKILYHENLSSIDGNLSKSDPIVLNFNNIIFTQGTAPLSLKINFDRDRSVPLNPFDFNITSVSFSDSDGINNLNGVTTLGGNSTFVYGRARAYDIQSDQLTIPAPIELEVYSTASTGYVSTMPQNILNWYRNSYHTLAVQGEVLSGEDYPSTTKSGSSSTISIDSTPSPSLGQQRIFIMNPDQISKATVHLDISPWLWYSPTQNYDFSIGSKCTQHPCFTYTYFNNLITAPGVSSGTFTGSDFTLTPSKTTIKKGIKVFR